MSLLVKAGCRQQLHQSCPSLPFYMAHGSKLEFLSSVNSLVQGCKSWASHSPLPLSLSPPTVSTAAAKETFAFSPQESEGRFLLQGVMQAHLSSDKVISTPGPQAEQIRTF